MGDDRLRRNGGFSLLEVLLGALLFASVFAAVAAVWRFHEISLQKYRNRNAARFLAEQEMERLTALPYPNLEVGEEDKTLTLVRSVDGIDSPMEFLLTTTVTENKEESLKSITLELRFEERGQERSMKLYARQFRSD